jgi:hypothetical protein
MVKLLASPATLIWGRYGAPLVEKHVPVKTIFQRVIHTLK